jgi:gluconate 2-dehydrogenase gamma chain
MSNSHSGEGDPSRRAFLLSSGGLLTSLWVAANWPGIAAAAHHADDISGAGAPSSFDFFTPAEAPDVEAIAAQIVPSGATPGAREAHAVYFIDHSFATYFAAQGAEYRKGLAQFQGSFKAAHGAGGFAAAPAAQQIEFLTSVEHTPFFETTRMFTILGMFTSPKYGGNYQGSGWKLMGFVDQHAFAPPFGHYDRDYPGFVPYPKAPA